MLHATPELGDHFLEGAGFICVEGIVFIVAGGLVAPVFVGPEPVFRALVNALFKRIPALLDKCLGGCVGRAFDGFVINDVVAAIGERLALHRDNQRICPLGEGDMSGSDAREKSAECLDGNRSLGGADVQIDEETKFAATLEELEHFHHGAFLWDDIVPGDRAQLVEDRPQVRIPELLCNDGKRGHP